ncbi:hypothetical protein FACS1894182_01470 [Bacteroidia bacterium]|nr:hypothetical protein FACS1894182_01470 [Bacteroidia bacterium]
MIKSIVSFFLFVLLPGAISAQAQEEDTVLTNYLRKAQYQQAIEYINSQEATFDLLYQKALCYKWLNNHSKTIEILEFLQNHYPDDIPVQLELAQAYEANLQYPKSIHYFERLIQADSTNTYFKVRRADLLYRAEKYTAALEDYRKIDPENYNPAYLKRSIALCYEKLNRPDSAKVYYQAAWDADIQDVFSALSLTKLCIQQQDYDQALLCSEFFLAGDSTNAQMNALNAFTYYNLNVYDEAVRRFEKCRAAGDSSLIVNRSLGISYYFLQNDSAAYPCLQWAYERDSTNRTVLYALASTQYNLSHYPEAIRSYQELIQRELANPHVLYTYYNGLAKAYDKDSLYNDAARNYFIVSQYASSNEQKMDVFFHLSTLLEFNLKDYSKAVFYYTQYQATLLNYQNALLEKANPDPEEVKEIELKINELNKHIRQLKEEHNINYSDKIWTDRIWIN